MGAPAADQMIRCPECGNTIAVLRADGHVLSRRAGRGYWDPKAISCERKGCNGVWRLTDGG